MVKGITKRVVVVKAPIGSIFDEAIFIIRDNTFSSTDVDAEKLLREACSAADEYVKANCTPRKRYFKPTFILSAVFGFVLLALCILSILLN